MKKRVISWLLTVVMVVSLLPTSVLADTLAADQEQQTQQEQIAPVDTENTVPAGNEETQEQQEPAEEVPVSQMARSGGTDSAPTAINDADDFRDMVAGGSYKLAADITVTEPYANDFSGTFDGNGHTVTLNITDSTADVGLFKTLSGGAVVKNVITAGSISSKGNNVGGIAGSADTDAGDVTIENCKNTAAITGKEEVGGILGRCSGSAHSVTVTGCINTGTINGTNRKVGGICGNLEGTHVIRNCYNTGGISVSKSGIAGILGRGSKGVLIENCYSVGNSGAYALLGTTSTTYTACQVKNCYALEGSAQAFVVSGVNADSASDFKTETEMKSPAFAALLGDGFMVKSGDYPALSWETPTAAVSFTIQPENAVLTINGGTYTGSTTVALPAADAPYSYTVSCPGYTQQTGSVTVTNKDNPVATPASVTVTLAEDAAQWVTVTFTVTPENATLTLKDGETQVAPTEGTTYQLLKGHAYTYTAETTEEGYEPAVGTVTPTENSTQTVALKKVRSITLKGSYKTEYEQRDELDTSGLTVTVTYTDGTTRDITEGFTVTGFDSTNAMESQTLTVTYRGATAPYTIKINEKLFPSTVFNSLKGYATVEYSHNSSYTGEDGKEFVDEDGTLVSNNKKTKNASVTITITFLEDIKTSELTFDYRISSESSDKVTIKKNSEQLLSKGGTVDWTNQTIEVKAGDEVTITYAKDYSVDTGSDCVWLKNFTVSPLYTLTIAPDQTDATVTLKDKEGKTVSGSNGVFAVKAAADYTYTVTKKGYEPATGKVTMSAENQTVNVTLVKLPVITLTVSPADATVKLTKNGSTVSHDAKNGGEYKYIAAKNTAYTYTVSKFGYETATGTIKVETGDVNKTVTLTEAAKYSVTFQITKPEGVNAEPTITVNSGSITAYTGSGANCTLPAGDYTYTAKLDGCDTLSGSFVVKAAKTIGLEFVKSLTFNDFFAGLDGITAENGTRYGFEPVRAAGGNYLESNRRSYGATSLTLTATESRLVSFRYLAKGNKAEYSWEDDSAFTVKKGTTLLTAYEENGWKTFSTVLNKDEKLTLSFSESGSSYYVRLKDFAAAAAHTLTLNTPDGATVVLKDRSGAEITGKNGAYTVAAGTYTYTVSKFGYETKTGNITVSADVNETVTLSELATHTLTFAITPAENAKVTVTHPVGGTIKPETDGGYKLYLGETYAYTVTKADYIPVHGSITAAEDKTLSFTLTYAGEGWDGTAKTAPTQDKNGVYQIGTAAKLAWFADAVNKGDTTISGKLTANINLNGKTWTAIGTDSNKFAGTLDGDSHTVSGLAGTGGLVYYLSANGTVKSLCVDCAIDGTSNVGGIADKSEGRIENCLVSGYIKGGDDVIFGVGGIVGHGVAGNVISGCVSTADILFKYSRYAVQNGAGGIVGYTYGTVENCYFAGNVHTNAKSVSAGGFGGLVGCARSNAVMKDCYTVGAVTGPESSFGAVVGKVNSGATITNCAYLDTVAPQAAADGTTSGMTAHTAGYMRSAEFAVDMGMNQDDGTLNGGFPVLPWQGGAALSADDLKAAAAAANALQLRGMSAADAAKKAKADWYAENVLGLYELTDGNYNKADLCKEYGIEEPGEAVTDLHDYFLTALQKHFYKEQGLDAENADLLKADATGVYQLRGLTPVSGDPEEEEETAQTYTGFLTLPASVTVPVEGSGEKIVSLTWTADNALVNTATGALTAPAEGKVTVTLTATLQSGAATKVKTFTLCLWSENAEKVQTLEDIAAEFARKNTAVQPLQGVGLYDETNITQAFRRLLAEQGYADVADKAEITYVNGSAKANGFDGTKVQYIADNGDIEYFTGDGTARQTVQYTGLKFNITYAGVTKEITLRATVGRSADAVQKLLESAAGSLNWELIRGENTNGATQSEVAGWTLYTVNDRITSNLTLPSSIAGRYDVKVQWGTRNTEWLYITNGTGVGTVNRPLQPADGTALPEKAGKFRLIARVTYDAFDDYTLAHITGDNGVEVYADVLFDATVAPFDSSVTSEMQNALAEKYQGLLRDFVDKTKPVDTTAVGDDMQMPRPALLEKAGIMTDSYNQKVTMVSLTPDVLDFNGYHAMVYRPLPGEKRVEAKYVVIITTRSSGLLLARQEFSFTIQPFTQQELDGAADFMTEALTGDVYWDGIKNKNTDKTKVTSDLYPFAEICKNEDGTLEYVRGTVNMTFDGIEADDIPGWLDTEKYRCFRSSRPSVIENELLRVHQPEYNTTVTLDSVLTYTKYAQYWEKFGLNGTEETKEKYKLFEQFYKQPVSVDLRVTGLTEKDDPNENAMITVTVQVDSYNENKHSFTGTNYTFTGKASNDWTAWDAVKACLDNAKYEYTGSGAYLKSITDTKGQTLGEKDDGKSSGWMFGVTPAQGEETLPNTTLDATFIHDGDTVRLFFTNKYIPVDPDEPVDPGTEVPNFDKVYADTKKYIQNNVPAPVVAYDRGEWAVLGLARAGVALPDEYIQAYYDKVVAYVQKNMGADGVLVDPESHNPTVTDNERIILALTAIGKDPANVGGKNLLAALQDRNIMQVTNTSDTDINGLVFGLLALNSGNYTQDSYWLVQAILTQQNEDGSWSVSAEKKPDGDVDMTAMALQALAPYYNEGGDTTVNAAVDKALQWLSAKYKGTGYTSAESCAQVVVALSALQLNANSDSSFVKTVDGAPTSVLGDLLRYYLGEGQGFKHTASGKTADQKATEQALYAMAAYERYCRRTKALYDMTDAVCAHSFGDWQVVSPATCTADGSRQRVCTRCGAVEVQTLPAAGHKFGEWTTTKEPTCTETGTEKRTCSVCSKEETRVIAALGHTPGTKVSVDKNDHWNICEVCHQPVNKTEHTYVNGIQCVCGVRKGAEGDADTTIKRVVVSDEITFALEDNDKLNTPDKVKAELQLQITLKNSKSNKDNTVFMDVSLLVFENNGWRPATKEDLTAGKITVLLPYPEAVAAKYGQYNFTVAHMVAMADCGLDVGTVEFPAVTKTASGLLVTLTGLSPVAISWTESTNHYYYNPTATPDKTDSANTADDSQMVLWLGSAVLAAAAVVVLTRKKRVSK